MTLKVEDIASEKLSSPLFLEVNLVKWARQTNFGIFNKLKTKGNLKQDWTIKKRRISVFNPQTTTTWKQIMPYSRKRSVLELLKHMLLSADLNVCV